MAIERKCHHCGQDMPLIKCSKCNDTGTYSEIRGHGFSEYFAVGNCDELPSCTEARYERIPQLTG